MSGDAFDKLATRKAREAIVEMLDVRLVDTVRKAQAAAEANDRASAAAHDYLAESMGDAILHLRRLWGLS
jgi:hypothetical protein